MTALAHVQANEFSHGCPLDFVFFQEMTSCGLTRTRGNVPYRTHKLEREGPEQARCSINMQRRYDVARYRSSAVRGITAFTPQSHTASSQAVSPLSTTTENAGYIPASQSDRAYMPSACDPGGRHDSAQGCGVRRTSLRLPNEMRTHGARCREPGQSDQYQSEFGAVAHRVPVSVRSVAFVCGVRWSCSNQLNRYQRPLQHECGAIDCTPVQRNAPLQNTSLPQGLSGLAKQPSTGPLPQAFSRAWRNTGSRAKSLQLESSRSFSSSIEICAYAHPEWWAGLPVPAAPFSCGENRTCGASSGTAATCNRPGRKRGDLSSVTGGESAAHSTMQNAPAVETANDLEVRNGVAGKGPRLKVMAKALPSRRGRSSAPIQSSSDRLAIHEPMSRLPGRVRDRIKGPAVARYCPSGAAATQPSGSEYRHSRQPHHVGAGTNSLRRST